MDILDVHEGVISRLTGLGYAPDVSDPAIGYDVQRAADYIRIATNRSDVPEELERVWIDLAAGYYLADRRAAGQEGAQNSDGAPVKRITEGDVTVEFAGESDGVLTPDARLEKLIDSLTHPPREVFIRYRRLAW